MAAGCGRSMTADTRDDLRLRGKRPAGGALLDEGNVVQFCVLEVSVVAVAGEGDGRLHDARWRVTIGMAIGQGR